MTSKEETIKELKKIMPCTCLDAYKNRNMADPECSWCGYGEDIVDFIIKDRKRIVDPLLVMKNENFPGITTNGQLNCLWDAAAQTITNAGVEI